MKKNILVLLLFAITYELITFNLDTSINPIVEIYNASNAVFLFNYTDFEQQKQFISLLQPNSELKLKQFDRFAILKPQQLILIKFEKMWGYPNRVAPLTNDSYFPALTPDEYNAPLRTFTPLLFSNGKKFPLEIVAFRQQDSSDELTLIADSHEPQHFFFVSLVITRDNEIRINRIKRKADTYVRYTPVI